jgi:Rrf2 family iron-sulfur cluster assembly transcriptional regulator
MFLLSKKTLYAIEAVLDIAFHASAEPVQSREITRRQGIPRRYLEQALQNLVHQGVLVGIRGPRGGYRLARERRRISVGDIVRVVRSMEATDKKPDGVAGSELGHKVVRLRWLTIEDEIMARLDTTSIDDLCDDAETVGIVSEGRQALDFSI